MTAFHDMHCHLDFMVNAEEVASRAGEEGTLIFANTVTPEGWSDARKRLAPFPNVAVGFGMHPWWVAGNADGVPLLLEESNPSIIGEIGLDLGRRHAETAECQVGAFTAIVSWASRSGGKLLSLHSVHAAREALDILESARAFESCACIFHWFTGPSDQLKRAIDAGAYFSVGPRMLATGKGREYVKAIPSDRLLLETDAPPEQGQRYSYAELRSELERAAAGIAAIKGEAVLEGIAATARRLISQFKPDVQPGESARR